MCVIIPLNTEMVLHESVTLQTDTNRDFFETKSHPLRSKIPPPLTRTDSNDATFSNFPFHCRARPRGLQTMMTTFTPPPTSPPPPPAETFDLQVLHASPDAPAVDVLVNGSAILTGVDYKVGSGIVSGVAGTQTVQVDGITPGGPQTVIGPVDLDLAADTQYSIVLRSATSPSIEPIVLDQPSAGPAAGNARLRVLHAAPMAPQVDVYATTPGADLTATAPVGTFEFKGDLGPVEVPAGDYQIRVTLAGDPAAVAFDSGTVTLRPMAMTSSSPQSRTRRPATRRSASSR